MMTGATATWPPETNRNFLAANSRVPLLVAMVHSSDTPSSIMNVLELKPLMMSESPVPMTAPKIHAARTAIRPTFFFITNPTAMTAIRTTSEINAILLLTRMPPFSWFHPTWPCGVETLGQIATIEHSASAT